MKRIPLTKGKFAVVDDDDFDALNAWNWYYQAQSDGRSGYATRAQRVDGKPVKIRMHRQILGLPGDDKNHGDHINGDKLDNRKENLRVSTVSQNMFNKFVRPDCVAGMKGVSYRAKLKKYVAQIQYQGKQRYLGLYASAEEAHEVYCLWADMICGNFANYGALNA